MNSFMLETAFLLVTAFIIGAALGCFFRSIFAAKTAAPTPDQMLEEAPAQSGQSLAAISDVDEPKDVVSAAHGYVDYANYIEKPCISTAHGYKHMAKYIAEFPFPEPTPVAASAEPRLVEPETSPENEPDEVQRVIAAIAATSEIVPSSEADKPSQDNLALIKGIDSAIAQELQDIGIKSFEQIANLVPADVSRINTKLGAAAKVENENWIEQAKILATGKLTKYAEDFESQSDKPMPTSSLLAARSADNDNDDDTGSGGAGPGQGGVPGGNTSAAGSGAAPASSAGAMSRISGGEEAGTTPAHAIDDMAEFLGPIITPAVTPRPGKRRRIYSGNAGFLSVDDDFFEGLENHQLSRPIRKKKIRRSSGEQPVRDDLKKIPSIGVVLEKKLNGLGIHSFGQIAQMREEDLQEVISANIQPAGFDIEALIAFAKQLSGEDAAT